MDRKSSKALNVVFLLIIVAIAIVAVIGPWGLGLVNGLHFGSSKEADLTWTTELKQTFPNGYVNTLVPSGTDWKIDSGSAFPFRFGSTGPSGSVIVSGTFTSTLGVAVFVVTNSTWNSLGSSNPPQSALSQYVYTSGNVTSGSVDLDLSIGTAYVIVVYIGTSSSPHATPTHNYQYTTVNFTTNLTASFPGGYNFTIDPKGTNYTLNATLHEYEYTLFYGTVENFTLKGNFTASNPVDFFIVNATYWNSTSSHNQVYVYQSDITYLYTTGEVTSYSISANLTPGWYYWLIYS